MSQVSKHLRKSTHGYSFYCQGCKCMHHVNTDGTPPSWHFSGDVDRPTFSPSVLVTWEEPANLGNPGQLQKDIEDARRRREAGEENPKVPTVAKRCHTFVGCNGAAPGEIIFLDDCTHEFRGVHPLAELPNSMQG